MHRWLSFIGTHQLIWALRSLPALLGVAGIAAIYYLNRLVFSPTAGLMAAALMAVSPFGVYLSQEARHYTLPMLLITLALLGLIHIQQRLYSQQQPHPLVWLFWGIVNSIGGYVHYFFFLAFIAQLLVLIGLMVWRHRWIPRPTWMAITLVVTGVVVSYLPWLSVLWGDIGQPETNWLPTPENIAPLFQLLIGWLLMVIALPVEGQPLWIEVGMGVLMIGVGGWIGWQGLRGIQQLAKQPSTQVGTFTLCGFTLCVFLQFLAIIYLLGKDISVAPRYNFVNYPGICALLGASFTMGMGKQKQWQKMLPLGVSLLSTVFVVSNLVFIKPFHPQQVVQTMNLEPAVPMMMVVGYENLQEVALGLSFVLAMDERDLNNSQESVERSFVFLNRDQGYEFVWQKLSELPVSQRSRLNLWVVAPGLRRLDYPQQLAIANQPICTLDPTQHYRLGIPYQLYRCHQDLP